MALFRSSLATLVFQVSFANFCTFSRSLLIYGVRNGRFFSRATDCSELHDAFNARTVTSAAVDWAFWLRWCGLEGCAEVFQCGSLSHSRALHCWRIVRLPVWHQLIQRSHRPLQQFTLNSYLGHGWSLARKIACVALAFVAGSAPIDAHATLL